MANGNGVLSPEVRSLLNIIMCGVHGLESKYSTQQETLKAIGEVQGACRQIDRILTQIRLTANGGSSREMPLSNGAVNNGWVIPLHSRQM